MLETGLHILTVILGFAVYPAVKWAWDTNARLVKVESKDDTKAWAAVERRLSHMEEKIDDLTAFLLRVHGRRED